MTPHFEINIFSTWVIRRVEYLYTLIHRDGRKKKYVSQNHFSVMAGIYKSRMALTSNWFSITAIRSHSSLLIRTNSETVLLLFWTFGILATSSQSRLDLPQFTSSSFWLCLQSLSGNVCIYTYVVLSKVRSQYLKKIIESIFSVWKTLTFRKNSASLLTKKDLSSGASILSVIL